MNIIDTNLQFRAMDTRTKTERIILHHAEATNCTAEDIHRWHLNNGWAGAGYHFLVRKDGTIYRLRPEDKVGAHAYGSNYNSIGIVAEGKYMEETMPEVQKQALKELVAYLKQKYGISKVQRHREVCNTNCPGTNYPFDEIIGMTGETQKIVVYEKKECIKELQALLNKVYHAGLVVDGIIGEHTNNALRRVALKNYTANDLVAFVQRRLIMNGCGVGNCGADGKYGRDTANAVEKFQKKKGLSADKIAGINTIKALL